mmetsp:Transcript_37084/g.38448  ORF Transcript_37084/g.38448 Transcript_37084/m.38448 type:complete len:295 (+) Transcript_37084:1-885(+)
MESDERTYKKFEIVKDTFPSIIVIFLSYISLSLKKPISSGYITNTSHNAENSDFFQDSNKSNSENDSFQANKDSFKNFLSRLFELSSSPEEASSDDTRAMFVLIRFSLLLFSAFLVRGCLKLCLYNIRNEESTTHKFLSLIIEVFNYAFNMFYYVFVVFCVFTFLGLNDTCLFQETYTTILIAFYTIIGCCDTGERILFSITVILSLPVYISAITSDSKDFFLKYGVSEDLLDSLDCSQATKEHVNTCVICTEEINEGNKILILKCSHHYHSECLKRWLSTKYSCPICRSKNIF